MVSSIGSAGLACLWSANVCYYLAVKRFIR